MEPLFELARHVPRVLRELAIPAKLSPYPVPLFLSGLFFDFPVIGVVGGVFLRFEVLGVVELVQGFL